MSKSLGLAYAIKRKTKKMAAGGVASPTDTATKTGGSNPGGASTGGIGSGLGGAGTGGAATGGASTGGAGTVTVSISGSSSTETSSGAGAKKGSGKGDKGKPQPVTLNISNVGGTTGKGSVTSGDGPGASGSGGRGADSGSSGTGGMDPGDNKDMEKMAKGGMVPPTERGKPNDQSLVTDQAKWRESDLMELDPDLYNEYDLKNQDDDEDQNAARKSVLSKIMRKFRR